MEFYDGLPVFEEMSEIESHSSYKDFPLQEVATEQVTVIDLPERWGRQRWNGVSAEVVAEMQTGRQVLAVIKTNNKLTVLNRKNLR